MTDQLPSNQSVDIVDRLRAGSRQTTWSFPGYLSDAADEIERLRADRQSELRYVVGALTDTRSMRPSELRDHIEEVRAWAANRLTVGASAVAPQPPQKKHGRSQAKRFSVPPETDGAHIYDDDFHWDGMLVVTGDFESDAEKRRYAAAIAAVLNDHEDRIPTCPADETPAAPEVKP